VLAVHPYQESEVATVTAHVNRTIGDPSLVAVPYGFPNSLALCVLDAIWSLAANYDTHVANVYANYRRWRADEGANAAADNLRDLGVFD
jgi:hypothetical protein